VRIRPRGGRTSSPPISQAKTLRSIPPAGPGGSAAATAAGRPDPASGWGQSSSGLSTCSVGALDDGPVAQLDRHGVVPRWRGRCRSHAWPVFRSTHTTTVSPDRQRLLGHGPSTHSGPGRSSRPARSGGWRRPGAWRPCPPSTTGFAVPPCRLPYDSYPPPLRLPSYSPPVVAEAASIGTPPTLSFMVGKCPSRLHRRLFGYSTDGPDVVTLAGGPPPGAAGAPSRVSLLGPQHLDDLRKLRGILELSNRPRRTGRTPTGSRGVQRVDHHVSDLRGRHFALAAVIDPPLDLVPPTRFQARPS